MPFRDIVGHRAVLTLLARAIAEDSLPPSLLLTGVDGVGKRRVAVAVAQAMNCAAPTRGTSRRSPSSPAPPGAADGGFAIDACGRCGTCRRIDRGTYADVVVVEPGENGTITIDQVRTLVDQAGYRPFEGRRRVMIVDRADQLGSPAQHALLKTLEEPPDSSQFLLVSARPDMLLDTVRSRCPQLRFGQLDVDAIVGLLTFQRGCDEGVARAAAASAGGSVGRALSVASGELATARDSAVRLLDDVSTAPDPRARLGGAKALVAGARARRTPAVERDELRRRLHALASLLRDMEVLAAGADAPLANADLRDGLTRLAASYGRGRGLRAFAAVDEATGAVAQNASTKVVADWLACRL